MLNYLLAGLGAALVAGALVGLGEGLSVFFGDPAVGSTGPLYGVVFYAALLGLAGPGLGLVGWIASRLRDPGRISPRWTWVMSLIATLVPVAVVVVRFRIVRDVFHEKLALTSGAGIGVHLGLVALAAVLAGGLWFALRPSERTPLGRASAPVLTGALLAAALVIAAPFLGLGGEAQLPKGSGAGGDATRAPVILIMVDTLRADRLTPYGYAKDTSPHLAAFAKDAVVFEKAFAQASWTRPSTATLLTSLPPSAHATMYKPDRLPESVESVGEVFTAAKYTTGGRVTNYNIAPYFNFAQGFDDYRYLEPDYYWWADEGSSKLSLYNLARVVRERVAPSKDRPAFYYQDAQVTTDAALTWIDAHKEEPFFLFLTYMDPHDPYFARPLNGEAWSRAATLDPDPKLAGRLSDLYDGEITYWDEHFGRLVAELKKRGLYDRAVIAVTSDHGEEFQEHGGWWHGTTLYEEQIHVPLLVKRPGNADGGKRVKALAQLMDVAPTLAAQAGVAPAASWRGRDLLGDSPEPAAIFAEEDHQGNVLRALRGQEWKIIEANAGNPRGLAPVELYRIDQDPGEQRNVAQDQGEVLAGQQKALEDASKGAIQNAAKRDSQEIDEDSQRLLKELGYIEE